MKEINGGKQMRNLFDVPNTKTSEKSFGKHPSQKPIEVIKNLVLALTNEDDIIIDPFSGSGTTAFVAKQNNRKFIGVECDENYVDISNQRIASI